MPDAGGGAAAHVAAARLAEMVAKTHRALAWQAT